MNQIAVANPRVKGVDSFAARCASAGVFSWSIQNGVISLNEPARLPSSVAAWLQSSDVQERLTAAACSQAADGSVSEPAPGWRACHLARAGHGSRGAGTTLLVALCRDPLTDHTLAFQRCCAEASLDPLDVSAEVAPFLHDSPAAIDRLFGLLRASHDDLARAARERGIINQFSERLAQAFEETNLMFRMARLLNSETDPLRQLQSACGQIGEVLPFGWLAIRFFPGVRLTDGGELAGATMSTGDLPCDLPVLERMIDGLIKAREPDDWTKILTPAQSPLAEMTGQEVLAEPIAHDGRIVGAILAGNKRGSDPDISSEEMQFLDATADFLGAFHENVSRFSEQHELFLGTLRALTGTIDAKDPYTRGHSERVASLAAQLAGVLKLPDKQIELFRVAGLVHDIGKIGVAEEVLRKPGRLTREEFEQIKQHPEMGYRILKDVESMSEALPGVMHHHEKWNGQGYPHGIAGEQIPLIARVLALADTFDAMSSNRSYRGALPRHEVLAEIARCAGTQFDPTLAPIFVDMDFSGFDQLLTNHARAAA